MSVGVQRQQTLLVTTECALWRYDNAFLFTNQSEVDFGIHYVVMRIKITLFCAVLCYVIPGILMLYLSNYISYINYRNISQILYFSFNYLFYRTVHISFFLYRFTLGNEPTSCPKIPITKYQYTTRNNPEEQRVYLCKNSFLKLSSITCDSHNFYFIGHFIEYLKYSLK
jgi:hypothetical protein